MRASLAAHIARLCRWKRTTQTVLVENIEGFKKFLGPIANEYSEAALHQLQQEMHAMAELLLEIYLHKKCARSGDRPSEPFDTPSVAP